MSITPFTSDKMCKQIKYANTTMLGLYETSISNDNKQPHD